MASAICQDRVWLFLLLPVAGPAAVVDSQPAATSTVALIIQEVVTAAAAAWDGPCRILKRQRLFVFCLLVRRWKMLKNVSIDFNADEEF